MLNEIINQWSIFLNQATDGNQMISGSITLGLMGILSFLARDIPHKMWEFLKRSVTTSMTLNSGYNDDIHEAFLEGKESPQRFLSYLNR